MTPYIDYSGKKLIIKGYQIGEDFIIVQFEHSDEEKYTVKKDGELVIKRMKDYAVSNKGLTEFIERYKMTLSHKIFH